MRLRATFGGGRGDRLVLQISTGGLRPLAVTSTARYARFPDIPTVSELGLGVDAQSWWGLLAPVKDPSRHHRPNASCASEGLEGETVRLSLSEQGLVCRVSSSEEFGRFIESEIALGSSSSRATGSSSASR